MIHKTIIFYHALWRVTSHNTNLLRRASRFISISCSIYNLISVTLWRSSKVADSVRHDKVLEVMLLRKTHLKYKAKQRAPIDVKLSKGKGEWVGQ